MQARSIRHLTIAGVDPVFDYEFWRRRISLDTRQIVVSEIVGPGDAIRAIYARERCSAFVRPGDPTPADLFVLGSGEPSHRSDTKIGGLPYWPTNKTWPCAADGELLPFFAQVDLRHSTDITGELPGDIVLVFGDPTTKFSSGLRVEWVRFEEEQQLVEFPQAHPRREFPKFFGLRWRTNNYHDWEPISDDNWSSMTLPDGTTVHSIALAYELMGFQVGAHPYMPPSNHNIENVFLTIPCIYPTMYVRYPLLNRQQPFESDDDCLKSCLSFSDIDLSQDGFAAIYFSRAATGETDWRIEDM